MLSLFWDQRWVARTGHTSVPPGTLSCSKCVPQLVQGECHMSACPCLCCLLALARPFLILAPLPHPQNRGLASFFSKTSSSSKISQYLLHSTSLVTRKGDLNQRGGQGKGRCELHSHSFPCQLRTLPGPLTSSLLSCFI